MHEKLNDQFWSEVNTETQGNILCSKLVQIQHLRLSCGE